MGSDEAPTREHRPSAGVLRGFPSDLVEAPVPQPKAQAPHGPGCFLSDLRLDLMDHRKLNCSKYLRKAPRINLDAVGISVGRW